MHITIPAILQFLRIGMMALGLVFRIVVLISNIFEERRRRDTTHAPALT